MSKPFFAALVAFVALSLASVAHAASITLVDRGLPTDNLNNAAGADRSNVAWAFTQFTDGDYWLVGDTFQNTSSQIWTIDTITLWSTGTTSSAVLWGGTDLSALGIASTGTTITPGAAYSNSETYQTPSGTYSGIQQIDFAVNISLLPGQTYTFFFDGRGGAQGVPYVHASNATLSGSPQQGSDNSMLYANVLAGALDSSSVGSWTSFGDGWDKASDVNVVVSGTVPDGGTTAALLGCALLGIGALRRKFSRA